MRRSSSTEGLNHDQLLAKYKKLKNDQRQQNPNNLSTQNLASSTNTKSQDQTSNMSMPNRQTDYKSTQGQPQHWTREQYQPQFYPGSRQPNPNRQPQPWTNQQQWQQQTQYPRPQQSWNQGRQDTGLNPRQQGTIRQPWNYQPRQPNYQQRPQSNWNQKDSKIPALTDQSGHNPQHQEQNSQYRGQNTYRGHQNQYYQGQYDRGNNQQPQNGMDK